MNGFFTFRRACLALATAAILLLGALPADCACAKGGRSGGFSGGRSYSSGSRSYSSGSSSSAPKSYSSSSGSTYSSGSSAKAKPASTSGMGSAVTSAQAKAASQKAYQAKIASSQPKTKYTSTTGKTVNVDTPTAKTAQSQVRTYVTHERYVTYDNRANQAYAGYSPSTGFNDYFSPFLMAYLLSSAMTSHDRAAWAYHHSDEIDAKRLEELKAKDAEFAKELEALKAANVEKDPTHAPPGLDQDLQYDKGFVTASLGVDENYQPPTPEISAVAAEEEEGIGVFGWAIIGVGCLAVLALGVLLFTSPSA